MIVTVANVLFVIATLFIVVHESRPSAVSPNRRECCRCGFESRHRRRNGFEVRR